MNRGVYATAAGMQNSQRWLEVVANNLANISTTGFKRDGLSFKDSLEQTLNANGGAGAEIGSIGSGPTEANEFTSQDLGPISETGNGLDVALKDSKAAFAVQTPAGIKYTRDGSFTVDSDQNLVTKDGFKVLDSSFKPISVGTGQTSISANGTVTSFLSNNSTIDGTIGTFTGSFTKEGSNLYSAPDATAQATADLAPESLEGSNVNPITEMVDMININRTYELQQKSISQQDELSQKLISSMNS